MDTSELLDRHPAATVVVDPEGNIQAWNRAATELFGFSPEEALGKNFEELLVPRDNVEMRRELVEQAAREGAACYTADRMHKNGSLLPVSVVMDAGFNGSQGTQYLTFRPASRMVCLCGDQLAEGEGNRPPLKQLTTRQRQVLRLIAEGRSTRDIAHRLTLSVKTIETHRGHLMQRLKLRSVAGLVRYAVATGLVPASPWSTKKPE